MVNAEEPANNQATTIVEVRRAILPRKGPPLASAPGETGGGWGGFGPGRWRVTQGFRGWGGVAPQGPFRSRRPPHAKLVERLFTPLGDVTAASGPSRLDGLD